MQTPSHHINTATIRRIAVAASADPRSVEKRLRGEPVRGMVSHGIGAAIRTIMPKLKERR